MAISDKLNRRVRARPDDDDESLYSGESEMGAETHQDESDAEGQQANDSQGSDDEGSGSGSGSGPGSDSDSDEETRGRPEDEESSDADDDDDDDDDDEDIQASLSSVSFGALAKAQASMGPKQRKEKERKTTDKSAGASPLDDIRARILEAREQKRAAAAKENKSSRASKHAPMVQSSKHAVSRRRMIVEPPAVAKARDPRFDAAVMGHSGAGKFSEGTNKAYAFLDDYRASELKDLKTQLSRTKNAEQKEELRRQIRSAEDQMKTRKNQKREREVVAEHKKKEKQLIREGKKATPYYLKKSDLKKQVLEKKYEEMGSRDRAKALERRRKKIASKERKDMPMERRGMDDAPPDRGKRRRLA